MLNTCRFHHAWSHDYSISENSSKIESVKTHRNDELGANDLGSKKFNVGCEFLMLVPDAFLVGISGFKGVRSKKQPYIHHPSELSPYDKQQWTFIDRRVVKKWDRLEWHHPMIWVFWLVNIRGCHYVGSHRVDFFSHISVPIICLHRHQHIARKRRSTNQKRNLPCPKR